ncbi:Inner membrane protein YgaP [candidate division SR1 bacterium Aalborg_AAW-1]|nr:Inner membrane protein YgaP [candidate division SR1 bacterium Aalborg_AAW-1]
MKSIKPHDINFNDKNLTIIDVRTPEEFHLDHIQGAINMPLDYFEDHKKELSQYDHIIAYCNTGNSSSQFIKKAAKLGYTHITNLAGGLSACQGCPREVEKGPLPLMQQIQITAGSLVLLGIGLSILANNRWIGLSSFVGAGLVFAGATGRCGMGKILAMMPRNKIETNTKTTSVSGNNLVIQQFADKDLAHYSYMAISNGEAVVVDPTRNPQQYYDLAQHHNAKIVAVLNTHPHADFASGHLQIHNETAATIYVGDKVGAEYAHTSLQGGETIKVGTATIVSYFTPGHSPDSISYLIKDDHDKEIAFFTGDWVFIGDVGRADLREKVGNIKAKQAELAGMMYDSTREILPILDKNLMILPAHGAGTSCGKGLSKKNMDSLGNQLKYNPMLQEMSKEEFIEELTSDQPSIPPYFTNSVLLNKHGNSSYQEAKDTIPMIGTLPNEFDGVIIDTRSYDKFVLYPLYKGAINIPYNENFVGVLGSVILPTDKIIVIVEHQKEYEKIVASIMSIGYESLITGLYIHEQKSEKEIKKYTVIDLRSPSTFADNPLFSDAINIPLEELQSQLEKLDKTTTYIPYCGGSYKSCVASTILRAHGYQANHVMPG